jgi:hypothetical protein
VDLPVDRLDLAARRDQRAGVVDARLAGRALRDRAGEDPQLELARPAAHAPEDLAVHGLRVRVVAALAPQVRPHLGQGDEARAGRGRVSHALLGRAQVRRQVVRRSQLDDGDAHVSGSRPGRLRFGG